MKKTNYSHEIWKKSILQNNCDIKAAIQVLNETSSGIVLVVNLNGDLAGTISDGDIRRGLLRGLDLRSPVESFMNRNAVVAPAGLSREVIVELMSINGVRQIPIVDDKKKVIGLHLWEHFNLPISLDNTMVIMAGGRGSRLQPKTDTCPKPLLPVAGKPILEHIIENAKAEGFSRFILAVHYLGHMIEDYFGNGDAFGVSIEYLREEYPLGTAGALGLINSLPGTALVVTNGDVLSDIQYGELLDFHNQHKATATMAVRLHEWQNPFGVVKTSGVEIIGYEEKPITRTNINAGIYVIEPSAIVLMKSNKPCDMPEFFELIQRNNDKVIAYPIHERWIDVGNPDDLLTANS